MPTKCANCATDAAYTLADPGVNPLDYCGECLPPSFRLRAAEGYLPLVVAPVEVTKKSK